MKKVMKKTVLSVLLTVFTVVLGQMTAFAQISIDKDPATIGPAPYKDAVKRYLDRSQQKIIGGKDAPAGAYPWQVSLGVSWIADPYSAHFCGGSVYSDRWIVTASHCVLGDTASEDLTPSQMIITAGTNRLVAGVTRRNVKRIIANKNFNRKNFDNDIALIELFDPLPLSDLIKPVELLSSSAENQLLIEDAPLVVLGWGAIVEGGQPVRNLKYLDNLPFVPRTTCNKPLSYDGRITENMFCAGFSAGLKDSCQGDSGGPLTIETETSPKLAGIVSWGEGCARANKYGIYTRVTNYVDWIGVCVNGSEKCNK